MNFLTLIREFIKYFNIQIKNNFNKLLMFYFTPFGFDLHDMQ